MPSLRWNNPRTVKNTIPQTASARRTGDVTYILLKSVRFSYTKIKVRIPDGKTDYSIGKIYLTNCSFRGYELEPHRSIGHIENT